MPRRLFGPRAVRRAWKMRMLRRVERRLVRRAAVRQRLLRPRHVREAGRVRLRSWMGRARLRRAPVRRRLPRPRDVLLSWRVRMLRRMERRSVRAARRSYASSRCCLRRPPLVPRPRQMLCRGLRVLHGLHRRSVRRGGLSERLQQPRQMRQPRRVQMRRGLERLRVRRAHLPWWPVGCRRPFSWRLPTRGVRAIEKLQRHRRR